MSDGSAEVVRSRVTFLKDSLEEEVFISEEDDLFLISSLEERFSVLK